ncbi:hypothetical protein QT327_03705 [Olivibacter sp. 47]|uniref:hypothetical protein n=1 Tax=Olivibacter sp. 47 TaxID=3056486 RepID=UPI0025A38F0E|nr:hypothetical protein [Olivibacter sp. 47]MDM8173471.1 hypothetical protein [Olivibacter sp. 47]
MDILILHLKATKSEHKTFSFFEEKLKEAGHFVKDLSVKSQHFRDAVKLERFEKIDPSEWDCIFVFGSENVDRKINFLNKKFQKPIYLFVCNCDDDEYFSYLAHSKHNLFGVFFLNPIGIMQRKIPFKRVFYFSSCDFPAKRNFAKSIGLDLFHCSNRFAHQVIKIFNTIPDLKLNVYGKAEDKKRFEPYFNNNITFFSTDKEKLYMQKDIILLTYSVNALNATVSGTPVIIVGEKGFGGRLTDENLFDQLRTGIKGRIGGYLDEEIPGSLLLNEINTILNFSEDQIYHQTEKVRQLVSIERFIDNVLGHVEYHNSVFDHYNRGDYFALRAELLEGLDLSVTSEGEGIVILKSHNQLRHHLDKTECKFLESLISENNLSEAIFTFLVSCDEDYESAVNFVGELWRNKVLRLEIIKDARRLE